MTVWAKACALGRTGALFAAALVILTLSGAWPDAGAKAEIVQFWEDSEKPSVTGRAPKAAAKKARAARQEAGSDDDRPARKASRKSNRKVASLGRDNDEPRRAPRKSLSGGGGGISWVASGGCLNGTLRGLVAEVAASYGPVTVSSTCRSRGHNAAVGGAKRSQHLTGDAVDFRVHGNSSGAMAFLRSNGSVGGFHHYGGGLFHIDTGPKRTW
jgi:Peptidase M15